MHLFFLPPPPVPPNQEEGRKSHQNSDDIGNISNKWESYAEVAPDVQHEHWDVLMPMAFETVWLRLSIRHKKDARVFHF